MSVFLLNYAWFSEKTYKLCIFISIGWRCNPLIFHLFNCQLLLSWKVHVTNLSLDIWSWRVHITIEFHAFKWKLNKVDFFFLYNYRTIYSFLELGSLFYFNSNNCLVLSRVQLSSLCTYGENICSQLTFVTDKSAMGNSKKWCCHVNSRGHFLLGSSFVSWRSC